MVDHVQQVMQQIVAVAGDPLVTLESVGGRLGALYDQAAQGGDEQAMQIISATWMECQAMHQQTGAAVDMAAAAQKVANEYAKQRDAVVEQHTDLVKAVTHIDRDNPLVHVLVEEVQQQVEEDFIYSGAFISDNPAEDIVDGINNIPVTYKTAGLFFAMLTGGYELLPEQATRLAEFMEAFVADVEEAIEIDVDDPNEAA